MEANRIIDTLFGAAILSVALIGVTFAESPGVYLNGQRVQCQCPSCTCVDCRCTSAECECPTCKSRLQVAAEPIRLVLVTAPEWCIPCRQVAPHWNRVASENPGLMVEIDYDESRDYAKSIGVTQIPAFVIVQGDKPLYKPWVGRHDSRGIREMVSFMKGLNR